MSEALTARPGPSRQEDLFPDLPVAETRAGIVYLMTDWYLLKWGWTGEASPKPRSGQLRASIIGFKAGTRNDERAYLDYVKHWSVGGEWFRVPTNGPDLYWLMLAARDLGGWKGVSAQEALMRVIANNLKRAA